MGCEKANTTRGYWGIFLKYWILWASLEHGWFPLSQYGNGGIDSLTPVPRHTTGIGHPTCSLGGVKRATACEHMKYRVLRACWAVVKLLVFNCAFLKVSQELPTMLSHLYCFTASFLQLQAIQKLLHGRGEPLNFFSKKICPSSRKTNSIALQGYINWVTESL